MLLWQDGAMERVENLWPNAAEIFTFEPSHVLYHDNIVFCCYLFAAVILDPIGSRSMALKVPVVLRMRAG